MAILPWQAPCESNVPAHGNARAYRVADDEACEAFLPQLARVCECFDWPAHACCLKHNLCHLLVEAAQATRRAKGTS